LESVTTTIIFAAAVARLALLSACLSRSPLSRTDTAQDVRECYSLSRVGTAFLGSRAHARHLLSFAPPKCSLAAIAHTHPNRAGTSALSRHLGPTSPARSAPRRSLAEPRAPRSPCLSSQLR